MDGDQPTFAILLSTKPYCTIITALLEHKKKKKFKALSKLEHQVSCKQNLFNLLASAKIHLEGFKKLILYTYFTQHIFML